MTPVTNAPLRPGYVETGFCEVGHPSTMGPRSLHVWGGGTSMSGSVNSYVNGSYTLAVGDKPRFAKVTPIGTPNTFAVFLTLY